ncbi:outer membrane protein transport protein [Myxococcota bacterium]|nr:outer membrane protein transport protein [Myxococcota bacterium]
MRALSFLILLYSLAYAGGFSNPDFGIRRVGMFAVVAQPDDVTAVYHNPAGLLLGEGTRLYHHQSWFISDLAMRFYDSEGELKPNHDISPDWNVGAVPFIGLAHTSKKWAWGLGVYAPNAYGAVLPDDEPTRYHVTEALFVAGRGTASFAYAPTKKLSVGLSVSLIYVHLEAARYMNARVLADPDARFAPLEENVPFDALLELKGKDWTGAVDFGVLLHPTKDLTIGAVFAGGAPIDLEGEVKLTQADGKIEKATQKTEMTIPMELRGGINWRFAPDFELGMDIRWWHYQILQEQRTQLDKPLMGIEAFVDPKNYDNSWNWCIGMMYHLNKEVELMMGYQEDYTPIPEETFTLDNPSRDQRGISVGFRWQASENLRLGGAFVKNWFDLVDVQTSLGTPPSNVKGYGANTEIGFDVDYTF